MAKTISFSVLDVSPVRVDETPRDALQQTVDLALCVEKLGFRRFWVAEHHGVPALASAAPQVIIGNIAEKTSTIRVGSGGVMLPNHSPLVVAEQFGTLEALYPGRIDLGVGRSGGISEQVTKALRLSPEARERFPQDVRELQALFSRTTSEQTVRATPGAGLNVPIWFLGTSTFSAREAAILGLPFAFAAYIGHDSLGPAIEIYRSTFKPSAVLDRPYVMVAVVSAAADSDATAWYLFSSFQQLMLARLRGMRDNLFEPPADLKSLGISSEEGAALEKMLRYAITGSAQTVRQQIKTLVEETDADELMFLSCIHDLPARRRSFEIISEARDSLGNIC